MYHWTYGSQDADDDWPEDAEEKNWTGESQTDQWPEKSDDQPKDVAENVEGQNGEKDYEDKNWEEDYEDKEKFMEADATIARPQRSSAFPLVFPNATRDHLRQFPSVDKSITIPGGKFADTEPISEHWNKKTVANASSIHSSASTTGEGEGYRQQDACNTVHKKSTSSILGFGSVAGHKRQSGKPIVPGKKKTRTGCVWAGFPTS